MKKWIIVLIILAFCSGVKADPNDPKGATLWLFGQPTNSENAAIGTWIGYLKDKSEFGFAAKWRMFTEADTPDQTKSSFAYGIYGLRHLPDIKGTIEENLWPAAWLPESLTIKPAIGLEFLLDRDGQGYSLSPVGAIQVFEIICLQYQYNFFAGGATAQDGPQYGLSLFLPF